MENRWLIPISLGAGILIGKNWKTIEKYTRPYAKVLEAKTADTFNTVTRFFAEQKEHVEDMMAAAKIKKTAPVVSTGVVVATEKKAVRRKKRKKPAVATRKKAVARKRQPTTTKRRRKLVTAKTRA